LQRTSISTFENVYIYGSEYDQFHMSFETRQTDNRFEETTNSILSDAMNQPSSNTSIDNDKVDTMQSDLNESPPKEVGVEYPPPAQAALVMLAILLALFLTAIVRT